MPAALPPCDSPSANSLQQQRRARLLTRPQSGSRPAANSRAGRGPHALPLLLPPAAVPPPPPPPLLQACPQAAGSPLLDCQPACWLLAAAAAPPAPPPPAAAARRHRPPVPAPPPPQQRSWPPPRPAGPLLGGIEASIEWALRHGSPPQQQGTRLTRRHRFSSAPLTCSAARSSAALYRPTAMARWVSGSEKPKKSGPLMRCPVRCAMHTSVQGLVGEPPLNTAPVAWSITCSSVVVAGGGWLVSWLVESADAPAMTRGGVATGQEGGGHTKSRGRCRPVQHQRPALKTRLEERARGAFLDAHLIDAAKLHLPQVRERRMQQQQRPGAALLSGAGCTGTPAACAQRDRGSRSSSFP